MKNPAHQIVRNKREWEGSDAQPPAPFRGWHTRGFLPHCDKPGLIQFLTFRLEDALPMSRQHEWKTMLEIHDNRERVVQIERYLDRGYGACHLRNPEVARLVEQALTHFDGERYRLMAWVIMPNHLHVVAEQTASLSKIVQSWKSYTAARANRIVGASGTFWQEDYFDRYIRDEQHFGRVIRYVESNPVNAALCGAPEHWPFSSAHPQWHWTSRDLHQRYFRAHLMSDRWAGIDAQRVASPEANTTQIETNSGGAGAPRS